MSNYIAIDGGTTNTRIALIKNSQILDAVKFNVGVGKSSENKSLLADTLKNGINELLKKHNLTESDIKNIFVSGMLTSELGICPLQHITVPAGTNELKASAFKTELPEISAIPFVFVRGVKTQCENFEDADMMRGEETELMGIADSSSEECTYILPGSHSKLITTDKNGRITDFSTMLSGEMLAALSQNTILKSSFDLKTAALDEKYLIKGFEYCKKNGINKTVFKVRILKNIFEKSNDELYSFFVGAVLCGEILEILKTKPKKIIIAGNKQIKKAMYEILKKNAKCEVIYIPDESAANASFMGMIKIFNL